VTDAPQSPDASNQIDASRAVLERSQREAKPYDVTVCGFDFVVYPGVFSPRYFDSTPIFTDAIPVKRGQSVLEIGSGVGVTSVVMALRGASRVLAIDINAAAVANTAANAKRHGVEASVEARQGDVYSTLAPHERFDTIYWNLPFIYVEPGYRYRSVLERALYDPGYVQTGRYLGEARQHLAPGGRLLAGFADFGDFTRFEQLAHAHRWSIDELARGRGVEGGPVTFILYELRSQ
jgi:release factor glutamine methyltransferase